MHLSACAKTRERCENKEGKKKKNENEKDGERQRDCWRIIKGAAPQCETRAGDERLVLVLEFVFARY
jgi:hypothetical protein